MMATASNLVSTDLRWPSKRLESWKYTDMSRFSAALGDALSIADPTALSDDSAAQNLIRQSLLNSDDDQRLVWLDGIFQAELSTSNLGVELLNDVTLSAGPLNDSELSAIVPDAATHQYRIQITDQNKNTPLQLLFCHSDQADVVSQCRLQIQLHANTQATVIEEHVGGRAGLAIQQIEWDLHAGAKLHHNRIQRANPSLLLLAAQKLTLATQASAQQTLIEWGSRLSRLHSQINLAGEHASAEYHALSGLRQRQHVDHQVEVRHEAPHCRSLLRARGIVDDSARQVFNGKVYVARGAQKTDSDQLLRNLLLSDKAEVDAKPELEIYADDVRCAHGSTVGRLDEAALFYLRSRGLDQTTARRLLMLSFAESVLSELKHEELHAGVLQAFAEHMSLQNAI